MPFNEQCMLDDLLRELSSKYEKDVNFDPIEIEIPTQLIQFIDNKILDFLRQPRKRLFYFTVSTPHESAIDPAALAWIARHHMLAHDAAEQLKTNHRLSLDPIKVALLNKQHEIQVPIQIQQSFARPMNATVSCLASQNYEQDALETELIHDPVFHTIDDLTEEKFKILLQQLRALNIRYIEQQALDIISQNATLFVDGIIPKHLPLGFFIAHHEDAQDYLGYTTHPKAYPTLMAPKLLTPHALDAAPPYPLLKKQFPQQEHKALKSLLENAPTQQKIKTICQLLPELKSTLSYLFTQPIAQEDFFIALLISIYCSGGRAYLQLFLMHVREAMRKDIDLIFLHDATVQQAFQISPKGMKYLFKLTKLSTEQRHWWNTLTRLHLTHPDGLAFDFIHFFEAYTQVFLPKLKEKYLSLAHPCPIHHQGHFLITLNRILDVVSNAQNPTEQNLNLAQLNWGPLGAHFAMIQAQHPFKMVIEEMNYDGAKTLESIEDAHEFLQQDSLHFVLTWGYRYLGQHWPAELSIKEVRQLIALLKTTPDINFYAKKHMLYLFFIALSHHGSSTYESTLTLVKDWIQRLATCTQHDVSLILEHYALLYRNHQIFSLAELHQWIGDCLHYQTSKKVPLMDILGPTAYWFLHFGKELRQRLDLRIAKLNDDSVSPFERFIHFAQSIHQHQDALQQLPPQVRLYVMDILTGIYDAEFANHAGDLFLHLNLLSKQKSESELQTILQTLARINVGKSPELPSSAQFREALIQLRQTETPSWSHTQDVEKYLSSLPGFAFCKFGEANIDKLDDLIVEGLKDAVMKRIFIIKKIDAFRNLIDELFSEINPKYLPEAVKKEITEAIHALLIAIQNLIQTLEAKQPQFADIHQAFTLFETNKQRLLKETFHFSSFGSSHGKYLLSLLVCGEVDPQIITHPQEDAAPGKLLTWGLWYVHKAMMKEIDLFFTQNHQTHQIRDLTKDMLMDWFQQFNRTHSFTFFFKQELIEKKVVPMLEKTMTELDLNSSFKNSILEVARAIEPPGQNQQLRSDDVLVHYKESLENLCRFLNLLIELRNTNEVQYQKIYKTIIPLDINYANKILLIQILAKTSSEMFGSVLHLINKTFTHFPLASQTSIEYLVQGIQDILALQELSFGDQHEFLNMMAEHVMHQETLFPLSLLMPIKNYHIPTESQTQLIYAMIELIRSPQMDAGDLSSILQNLMTPTQSFLSGHPEQHELTIHLIKLIKRGTIKVNIDHYREILSEFKKLCDDDFIKLCKILVKLIGSDKHDETDIISISEITKQLVHFPQHLKILKDLFKTQPYPSTSALNQALLTPGSEALEHFCESFDYNPVPNALALMRPLKEHFFCPNTHEVIEKIENLMSDQPIPDYLKIQLAQQLSYIELLGFAEPYHHKNYTKLKNLTSTKRVDLNRRACELLVGLREKTIPSELIERTKLELLAYMREIYFRTTGKFPNTTQMLTLLISEYPGIEKSNLLMQIKTGEGKSILTPMLALLQWTQGGTVDICTANQKLLSRDFENSYLPFFQFFIQPNEQPLIPCRMILRDSPPKDYLFDAIHCSTLEDMALFRLACQEANLGHLIHNQNPIHLVLDECDDALLDQTTLYKLIANSSTEAQLSESHDPNTWIYHLAYEFIRLPGYQTMSGPEAWDEHDDVEQFKTFLFKKINELFDNDARKIILINQCSTSQLRQWIQASCTAALLVENKHFVIQTVALVQNELHSGERCVCVPLVKSIPKTGCCFTDGVQQALQVRCAYEHPKDKDKFIVSPESPVLAFSSAYTLIQSYQKTQGRLLGISGTPGDKLELKLLAHQYGIHAIALPPHTHDQRVQHDPEVVHGFDSLVQRIEKKIHQIRRPITQPLLPINPTEELTTHQSKEEHVKKLQELIRTWSVEQNPPLLIIAEDFDESFKIYEKLQHFKSLGFIIQKVTGKESTLELHKLIKNAGKVNTITIGTASLSRGIDIDPNHPEGLFVFQTYVESPRITTQIAGRAARNGKKGHWLPIYLIPGPQGLWQNFLYYVVGFFFPRLKRSMQNQAIAELQEKIKKQSIIERTYTQAIAEVQQKTLSVIAAWENFIDHCLPDDPKLKVQQFNWRQEFLMEMNKFQTHDLNEANVYFAIESFKSSLSHLYQSFIKEKWLPALEPKLAYLLDEDKLLLDYLKHQNLQDEFKTARAPAPYLPDLTTSAQPGIHQTILSTYEDKAGAKLRYEPIEEDESIRLKRAQCRLLLPAFIEQFCIQYPLALNALRLCKKNNKSAPHLDQTFDAWLSQSSRSLTDKTLIHNFAAALRRDYQDVLDQFDESQDQSELKALLDKLEPLIHDYQTSLKDKMYYEHFSSQKIFLSFIHLNQLYGLDSPKLNELKKTYESEIMIFLAEYLIQQFAWVISASTPFYEKFESQLSTTIAQAIFDQAIKLKAHAQDPLILRETYQLLKKHQIELQDHLSLSLGHQKPLQVISSVLKELHRLCVNPFNGSDQSDFYKNCELEMIVFYHKDQLLKKLENYPTESKHNYDLIHKHLLPHIHDVIQDADAFNLLAELEEIFDRLSTYPIYQPLNALLTELKNSMRQCMETIKLHHPHPKFLASPYSYKIKKFAELFHVPAGDIRIQSFENGLENHIELLIQSERPLDAAPSYVSTYKTTLLQQLQKFERQLTWLSQPMDDDIDLPSIDQELTQWVQVSKHLLQGHYALVQKSDVPEKHHHHLELLHDLIQQSPEFKNDPDVLLWMQPRMQCLVELKFDPALDEILAHLREQEKVHQELTVRLPLLETHYQNHSPQLQDEIQELEKKIEASKQNFALVRGIINWSIKSALTEKRNQLKAMEDAISSMKNDLEEKQNTIHQIKKTLPQHFFDQVPSYVQQLNQHILKSVEALVTQRLELLEVRLKKSIAQTQKLIQTEQSKERHQAWMFPSKTSLGLFFAKLADEEPRDIVRVRDRAMMPL